MSARLFSPKNGTSNHPQGVTAAFVAQNMIRPLENDIKNLEKMTSASASASYKANYQEAVGRLKNVVDKVQAIVNESDLEQSSSPRF